MQDILTPRFETVLGRCKTEEDVKYSYQQTAVLKLLQLSKATLELKKLGETESTEILLKAPTGSGKTIISGGYIDTFFNNNPKIVILWISETPNLTKQSLEKFSSIFELETNFYDGTQRLDVKGNQVIGVNWEKIKNKKIREDGEVSQSIDSYINELRKEKFHIITMIDEAHSHADSKLSREFLDIVNSDIVIHITATPSRIEESYNHVVNIPIENVQRAGFVKNGLIINELTNTYNESYRQEHQVRNITEYFLNESILKRDYVEEQVNEYAKLTGKEPFVPLLVIQLPNNSNELMAEVEEFLQTKGYDRTNGLAVYMSDDYTDELDNIGNDETVKILLFKQAISKGWDCPRASLITLLREPSKHSFVTQTIGRILRNPYLETYPLNYDKLNYGYVFIEETDNQVLKDVVMNIQKQENSVTLLKKDGIVTQLDNLQKAKLDKVAQNISEHANKFKNLFHLAIRDGWLDTLDYETRLTQSIDTLNISTSDFVSKVEIDLTSEETKQELQLSKVDIIRALNEFTKREKINEDILHDIILPMINENKPNVLDLNEFIVVNGDKFVALYDELSRQILNSGSQSLLEQYEIKYTDWEVPEIYNVGRGYELREDMKEQLYPYNEIWVSPNSLETKFSTYLDTHPSVELWYKNGDMGSKYFSLVYELDGEYKHFYPDFLFETHDNIYIIETKGLGIDTRANVKKVNALNSYLNYFNQNRDLETQTKDLIVGYVKVHQDRLYIYKGHNFERDSNTLENWELFEL